MFNILSFKSRGGAAKLPAMDEWFHSVVVDCADGLWDWNLATHEFYLSPKLKDLLGYEEKKTAACPLSWWQQRLHPDDWAEMNTRLQENLQVKNEFAYFETVRFLNQQGEYLWLEVHGKVLGEKGVLRRIAGIVVNTTPHKFLQGTLRHMIAEQEKVAHTRTRFLSTLNHELRSPLSGIMGMVSLLKETCLSEDQRHYIENIENSSAMLLELVNDMLDVSKLKSGKFEFEKIQFSMAEVIKQASELIRASLIKKNLTFNAFMGQEVPASLKGDPTRLQQILVNLLSNAAKFTDDGSITLTIKVKENRVSDHQKELSLIVLRFEVVDTGMGIDREVQERIFEDFTQADSSISRLYGGTGLGLSICKDLVQLMGGEIGVDSELGKGSVFWFEVPFERGEEAARDMSDVAIKKAPVSRSSSKLKILLVEDNQVNQEVIRGLLALLGDEVTVANNGKEAVEIFPTQKFDVVLMDLNMPVLDGIGATQAIRALPHGQVPIIAVTANTFTGAQENCLNYGITTLLTKPVHKTTLEEVLRPYRPVLDHDQEVSPSPPTSFFMDQLVLERLVNELGKEKVMDLLNLYRKDAALLVRQIKAASLPHDQKNFAHTLAGMSENLGIQRVGKLARDIMNSPEGADTLPLVQELENTFERVLGRLSILMDG